MSDEKDIISEASEGIIKMSFNENSDSEDDIEALKAKNQSNTEKIVQGPKSCQKSWKSQSQSQNQTHCKFTSAVLS